MGSETVTTLEKANHRAAIKCLKRTEPVHQVGESSILGSILVTILFDKYSKDQLIRSCSDCDINLDAFVSFDPIYKIFALERSRAEAL